MKLTTSLLIIILCMLVFLSSCDNDNTVVIPQQKANEIGIGDTGEMLLATMDVSGGVIEVRARGLVWNPLNV